MPHPDDGLLAHRPRVLVTDVNQALGGAETLAVRDQARQALREGGFMVKGEPAVAGMPYVIGCQ